MTDFKNDTHDADKSWSAHLGAFIWCAIIAGLIIGAATFVSDHLQTTNVIGIDGRIWIKGAALFIAGIFALIGVWHAIIAILWPILVFLGLVGTTAVKSGASVVKTVDEGGGLRSIVHRIWYGSQGPPQ